ncbi:siderophore-interacting protein [Brachybacterium sp. AOP25-B2-12]|uniref:siderophore-interacting protein n=1 Tax=Brachybacterium sp. AOP25-B2-12 TaxID=3457710 RepID=UPI00403411DC
MPRPSTFAFDASVVAIQDLSPSFRRITLGGEGLADFGIPFHPQDLRFKLIIPPGGSAVGPAFDLITFLEQQDEQGVSWYQAWLQVDPEVRGAMRTYTVRAWRDAERELDVDMVLHTDAEGHSGPASQWAETARVGDHLHIIGRSRDGDPAQRGGIEFEPGGANHLLLAGDETAVPAVASILDSLRGSAVTGRALLEVPTTGDVLELDVPEGIELQWLPRDGADYGVRLEEAVREAVRHEETAARDGQDAELEDVDVDQQILWDIPAALTEAAQGSSTATDAAERPFYAWVAGEAGAVKRIRRYLVKDLGVDRRQVAFMGYWRLGKAES